MSGTATARALPAGRVAARHPAVLAAEPLEGVAAQVAGLLDPVFLAEAGWDPVARVLSLPAGHRLMGRTLCRVDGCVATAHGTKLGGLCWHCFARLRGSGMSAEQVIGAATLPPAPPRVSGCAVPGCLRMSPGGRVGQRTGLCQAHSRRFRRTAGMTLERFLADPRVRALPALGPCNVAACARRAESEHGYCPTHYVRWRTAVTADPATDEQVWRARQPAVCEGGQVSLRGLVPLVVVQVLLGVQQRVRGGAKLTDVNLRAVCDTLRRQQATSIEVLPVEQVPGKPSRSLLNSMLRDVRRALADPGSEQTKDVWDLGIFGHPGRLSFTGLGQAWLREAAKQWAAAELPRHRGGGACRVQQAINALAQLSDSLAARPDRGELPAALGRPDIQNFLNRLAYLESTNTISRYHRNVIARGTAAALTGFRGLGLTRPGQPAAGLAGDFALQRGDIPAEPERGEPGRDLPAEVMTVLCANLDTLEPAEVKVATQIGIDTGRRPEDILGLGLDCLQRDKDGAAVLVYDNAKAHRLGRRLPINDTTATVIADQQARVRARFPHTPPAQLKLLPAPRRNPDGRNAISIAMLDDRHRTWVDALPTLRTRDGAEFPTAKITPYAYRHTYAQRHADAGVPIDVLAELLDHRNLNVTRCYYRVGQDRRREAVDKVTAMSFDRHGTRIWHHTQALLESEHARCPIAQTAVPYGTCNEPSNVQTGGGACPVRFRCVGCDHFRTDISYLPDLTGYLDDLLRTRERLTSAITGIDDWARLDTTPTEQEITRVRRLIGRIKADLDQLPEPEQAHLHEAVTILRRHRAVALAMPGIPATPTHPETEATA